MNDPRRLLDGSPSPLTIELLAAGQEENPTPEAARRALAAALLVAGGGALASDGAAAAFSSKPAAAAAAAKLSGAAHAGGALTGLSKAGVLTPALVKWLGVGVIGLAAAGGVPRVLRWVQATPAARVARPAATPPETRPTTPPARTSGSQLALETDVAGQPAAPSEVPRVAPDLPSSAPDISRGARDVPSSAPDVSRGARDVPSSAPDVPHGARDVPGSAPDLPSSAPGVPRGARAVPDVPRVTPDVSARQPSSFATSPAAAAMLTMPRVQRTALPPAPRAREDLRTEIASIDRARQRLQAGEAEEALRELAHYESDFPGRQLRLEVLMLRMEAYVQSGRGERARELAEQVLSAAPAPAHAARARAVLAGAGTKP
jgi:hypothetical protein